MKNLKFLTVLVLLLIITAIVIDYQVAHSYPLLTGRTLENPTPEFWVKVGFSALFSIAALYVIIFKENANDQTRQWAFSVLTLVAGVWIGTLTT